MTSQDIELSRDQEDALEQIISWVRGHGPRRSHLTFGGLAGTGKTTVIAELARRLPKTRTRWCAYTGKAAAVLERKLRCAGIEVDTTVRRAGVSVPRKLVSTVHSLIKTYYETHTCVLSGRRVADRDTRCGKCVGSCKINSQSHYGTKDLSALKETDLIVLDEASMIGASLWRDLRSFGIPILVVGDHGQLQPIGDNSAYLMDEPDVKLETLHRFAARSGINVVAHMARREGVIPYDTWGTPEAGYALKIRPGTFTLDIDYTDTPGRLVTLCARRTERAGWNVRIRKMLGYLGKTPRLGDRVICLRNSLITYNGLTGVIKELKEHDRHTIDLVVGRDDGQKDVTVRALLDQFGRPDTYTSNELYDLHEAGVKTTGVALWDYAYAMTVHKSQGSGYPRVIVMESRLPGTDEDHARWLYTAVTRAERKVMIIG